MKKVSGKIIEIKQETPDVKTFKVELNEKINFIPGQYCLVSIQNKNESKPFTFTNPPTKDNIIELTIKEIGKFTGSLFSLKTGDKLNIEGPMGESLNFDESIKENVVFLAGGSGITPFISTIRYIILKNMKNNVTLIFSNRTKQDIIYKKELEEIKNKENIKVIHTLTNETPDNWDGEKGRINKEMIEKHVNSPREKLWYICGPPKMVQNMKELLNSIGIPKDQIKWEDWQIRGKHD